jgi:tRNA-specific 2-thiouridylase
MRIAVLLSGGVDSSVALHLAKQSGAHELTAFYLKIWLEDELAFMGECPWEEDLKVAREVCQQAGVPLQVLSMQDEYHQRIVSYAVAELKVGRTPSPDIQCNQWIKFGLFNEQVGKEFDKIVTGHYAQVEQRGKVYLLKRSPDPVKDQTYFLSRLNQDQLARAWFPVGPFMKEHVRKLAQQLDLPNRARPDSQGICFLGKIKYPTFVEHYLGRRQGAIVDVDTGRPVGEHLGVWFHTIGQRKGLGMGGGPWYVVRKELQTNTLFVSHADRFSRHARRLFTIGEAHWIAGEPQRAEVLVKVRHSPHLEPSSLRPMGEGRWEVTLEHADQGIAPGQSAVLYDQEIQAEGLTYVTFPFQLRGVRGTKYLRSFSPTLHRPVLRLDGGDRL